MGFLSSCDLTVYKVKNTKNLCRDRLVKYAFQSIDKAPGEEVARGWANIDNFLDCEWLTSPPEKGEWLTFSFRRDKRSVQASVLKKHTEEQIAKYAAQGITSKKKDVKEEVKARLLAKADPVPSSIDCAVSEKSGLMLVASTSKSSLEEIEQLYSGTFGEQPVQWTTDANIQEMFVELFQGGLLTTIDGVSYTLSYAGQMTMTDMDGEDPASIVIKNDQATVEHALDNGFAIQKIKVSLVKDDDEAFTWDAVLKYDQGRFSIHGVKIPAPEGSDANKDDPDAMFVFRMDLFETFVNVMGRIFELEA